MRPKFEVGEVVILVSGRFPEFNGERTVHKVFCKDEIFCCRLSGVTLRSGSEVGFTYLFDEPLPDDVSGREILFIESSLRKKHTPGELNFTDLMASLSSPKLITHDH